MSDTAIRVENLGKMYRIGRAQQRHDTLRDTIAAGLSSLRPGAASEEETIWALKDVSFEVKRGEVLGVIGRNGAGKSTLLKILSRITEPSTGRAEIHGRVGSLLEVGTGFHPELTGRENIYLNGAILGMRRTEIARRFDEIVAFAEIEKFLDTPVKHYSSGMYVRLAFAVAAHLEPEILLVDEVLAVGDARFQRKCLGAMEGVAHAGRTVLFVSHNMAAVQSLCGQAMLLKSGFVEAYGSTNSVIARYVLAPTSGNSSVELSSNRGRDPGKIPIIRRVAITDRLGNPTDTFEPGSTMCLHITVAPPFALTHPVAGVGINTPLGLRVFTVATYLAHGELSEIPASHATEIICVIPSLPLSPGMYSIDLSAGHGGDGLLDHVHEAMWFSVEATDYYGCGTVPSQTHGPVVVRSEWSVASQTCCEG